MSSPAGRIVLLLRSPRVPVGLLSHTAWQALQQASAVLGADLDPAWGGVLREAGVEVRDLAEASPALRAGELLAALDTALAQPDSTVAPFVLWFGSDDGDPGLSDALAEHVVRRSITEPPPDVELLTASYDAVGSRLLDLVAVMDQLRSPGGCPWDAEQTHTSLLSYLLEETHEVAEAIEALPQGGSHEHLREELGDLLLQVFFHSRIAQEHPEHPFDIDEVAAGIVAKLVRRHPHVFADVEVDGADDVRRNWEQIKADEKARASIFDGIPTSLPALTRGQKMLDRVEAAGLDSEAAALAAASGDPRAEMLLTAIQAYRKAGLDAEFGLRAVLAQLPQA